MHVIHTQNELIKTLKTLTPIAFVPTMGNLHEGHIKLIQEALKKTKHIVVSIFINPLQFNSKEDFKNYPRTLEKDLSMLEGLNVPYVFVPSEEDILDQQKQPKFIYPPLQMICVGNLGQAILMVLPLLYVNYLPSLSPI